MRSASVAVTLSLFVGLASAAETRDIWNRAPTNLPPQDLGSALRSLAMQRRFQIIFASKEVALLRTQGAVGQLSVDEALDRILSGTGLTFTHLEDGTVAITRSGGTPAGKANPPDPATQALISGDGTGPGTAHASHHVQPDQSSGPARFTPADAGRNTSVREARMYPTPILSGGVGFYPADDAIGRYINLGARFRP